MCQNVGQKVHMLSRAELEEPVGITGACLQPVHLYPVSQTETFVQLKSMTPLSTWSNRFLFMSSGSLEQ